MTSDPHRDAVKARLKAIGYPDPQEIPEGEEESADLYARLDDDDAILIEVKSRVDDLEIAKTLRESKPGHYIPRDDAVERADPVSHIVRKAVRQLSASQGAYPGHPVLWFIPDPRLGLSSANLQTENGLLGIRYVSFHSAGTTEDWRIGLAYLAGRTDFHRFPSLAGAVVDSDDGSKLLVNPYYKPSHRFASTRLYEFFDKVGAAVNVDSLESNPQGKIFVVRGNFDRTDENVIAHLTEKHPNLVFQFMDVHGLGGYQTF